MKKLIFIALSVVLIPLYADAKPEVLATVGNLKVTSSDLEQAVNSSPFATQFVTMDEDEQASLRGDLLQRLVASRLLRLEAKSLGLDQSESFKKDLKSFRTGLLYKIYKDKLRDSIHIPEDVLKKMKNEFAGNSDALTAAKSAWISDQYRQLRVKTIQSLKKTYDVKIFEDRLAGDLKPDTVLLTGKDGLKITYADLTDGVGITAKPSEQWLSDRLYQQAELVLLAKAAEDDHIDVSEKIANYQAERLPALLIEKKQKEWTSDEKVLRDYLKAHPKIAVIPERRHIGQIVLKTRKEAEAVRKKILAGKSLFKLAGKYSIDPYGRSRNGDMGWIKEGTGAPVIEKAIAKLKDNEISEVIETPMGFHIITILERRPGGVRSFEAIKDRIRQAIFDEKLVPYINSLGEKYKVVWNVVRKQETPRTQK